MKNQNVKHTIDPGMSFLEALSASHAIDIELCTRCAGCLGGSLLRCFRVPGDGFTQGETGVLTHLIFDLVMMSICVDCSVIVSSYLLRITLSCSSYCTVMTSTCFLRDVTSTSLLCDNEY